MGGLFRAPKPMIVTPPEAIPPAATPPTPDQAAQQAQTAARAQSARGTAGLIATSPGGVLVPLPSVARKSLLGE